MLAPRGFLLAPVVFCLLPAFFCLTSRGVLLPKIYREMHPENKFTMDKNVMEGVCGRRRAQRHPQRERRKGAPPKGGRKQHHTRREPKGGQQHHPIKGGGRSTTSPTTGRHTLLSGAAFPCSLCGGAFFPSLPSLEGCYCHPSFCGGGGRGRRSEFSSLGCAAVALLFPLSFWSGVAFLPWAGLPFLFSFWWHCFPPPHVRVHSKPTSRTCTTHEGEVVGEEEGAPPPPRSRGEQSTTHKGEGRKHHHQKMEEREESTTTKKWKRRGGTTTIKGREGRKHQQEEEREKATTAHRMRDAAPSAAFFSSLCAMLLFLFLHWRGSAFCPSSFRAVLLSSLLFAVVLLAPWCHLILPPSFQSKVKGKKVKP